MGEMKVSASFPVAVEDLESSFDIQDYVSGAQISRADKKSVEKLGILAKGNIKVKVQSEAGESTIQILKPGDLVDIFNMSHAAASQVSAKLYAQGETRILAMGRGMLEGLVASQSELMRNVIQGSVHSGRAVLVSINGQFTQLRNYIYGANGLY